MLDERAISLSQTRPFTRVEYERLVEDGWFEDEPLELLRGRLVIMGKQGARHADVTARLHERFVLALQGRYDVRSHSPYAATNDSEPEPDVCISRKERRKGHPSRALLLIEVSDSSLRRDLTIKRHIYAENGTPEYWVVDLAARTVHVHTDPAADDYRRVQRFRGNDVLRPVALPDVELRAADLFRAR